MWVYRAQIQVYSIFQAKIKLMTRIKELEQLFNFSQPN